MLKQNIQMDLMREVVHANHHCNVLRMDQWLVHVIVQRVLFNRPVELVRLLEHRSRLPKLFRLVPRILWPVP